jgi:hypothetical protein
MIGTGQERAKTWGLGCDMGRNGEGVNHEIHETHEREKTWGKNSSQRKSFTSPASGLSIY